MPWIDLARIGEAERDLFPVTRQVPNVLRALTLAPDEVRGWRDISHAQYVTESEMMSMGSSRALTREQIELVAGRTSALNECFY